LISTPLTVCIDYPHFVSYPFLVRYHNSFYFLVYEKLYLLVHLDQHKKYVHLQSIGVGGEDTVTICTAHFWCLGSRSRMYRFSHEK
jgi:hypothetical protein